MKTVRNIIIIITLILILSTITFFSVRSRYVYPNPPGTIGNTAGNLNNGGLFCEADGIVYFSNAYDDGALYCMNTDESDIQKLLNVKASSINAGGKYLFFYQSASAASDSFASMFRINGIYRCLKNGKNPTCLKRVLVPSLSVCNNTIYYQLFDNKEGISLCRIDIDKKNEMQLDTGIINPASIQNNKIYFGGMEKDHYLYSLDTASNNVSTVFSGNVYNPIAWGDYVYYMDISSNYRLCRYSISNQTTEVLTEDRLDFFNVTDSFVYYQKSDATQPALKRVRLDGTNEEIVASGIYENINATSRYVYFNAYGASTPVFHTPVDGPVMVSTFQAAPSIQ